MIGELINHLWQSTLFAVAAGFLTVVFRRNKAQIRYWLWFSASVKFLAPFMLLTSLGSRLAWAPPAQKVVVAAVSDTMLQVSEPFTAAASFAQAKPNATDWVSIFMLGVWAIGFAAIVRIRLRSWLRIRAAVRNSVPMDVQATINVRSSAGLVEPGVVGLFRPVLLLPADIVECLTPKQLDAVLAHELCHVRRRDNLTSAVHMIVEAVFWFHPLVWWIGARLVEERERACDEAVLSLGSAPQDYAEGILSVCKSYLESPLRCVSGVTGADLKKRIQAILTGRVPTDVNVAKRVVLAIAGAAALAAPFLVGVMNAPAIRAQAQSAASVTPKFEVASIKPCKPSDTPSIGGGGARGGGRGGNGVSSPVRMTLPCLPVRAMIQFAYIDFANGQFNRGSDLRLEGGPSWIDREHYKVEAKAETDAGQEMMRGPMMQALLEDRFKLKIHRETREIPLYALTIAKGGLKLQPAADGGCTPRDPTKLQSPPTQPGQKHWCGEVRLWVPPYQRTIDTTATSMTEFSRYLSSSGRAVVDKTGIAGKFDIHLEFAREDGEPSAEPTAPSIFTALQGLGLKLEPIKGPREFLVIDSIQRPTEN